MESLRSPFKANLPLGTAHETALRPLANQGKLPKIWAHGLVSNYGIRQAKDTEFANLNAHDPNPMCL